MQINPSPERLSVMLGLLLVILATLPRYVDEGLNTRLSLLAIVFVVVAAIAIIHWRLLTSTARIQLLPLLRRLGIAVLVGLALMTVWHAFSSAWSRWQILLSHGATLGLLLHVLGLWWKPATNRS